MRQIERFAVGVAEMLVDEAVTEDEDIEEQCEALVGAPLEHLEAMSVRGLLSMFAVYDGQSERRAMALAVGLARRAAGDAPDDDRAAGARRRALALLDAQAAAGRPLSDELAALRESLVRQLGGEHSHH